MTLSIRSRISRSIFGASSATFPLGTGTTWSVTVGETPPPSSVSIRCCTTSNERALVETISVLVRTSGEMIRSSSLRIAPVPTCWRNRSRRSVETRSAAANFSG